MAKNDGSCYTFVCFNARWKDKCFNYGLNFFKFLQVFLSKARDKMFSLPFYSNVQICLRNRSSSEQASSMDIRTVIQLCDFDVNEYGGWMDTRSILGQQMHMAIAWLNTGQWKRVLPYEVIP